MPRSKNKVASHRRRKNRLKLAKGYWGNQGNVLTAAKNAIDKGLGHAYRDRKLKKRVFRSLWIVRINAAARVNGTTYSRLMPLTKKVLILTEKFLQVLLQKIQQHFLKLLNFLITNLIPS